MEHRPYQPVLSTGQARMPTLPKTRMPVVTCLSLPDAVAVWAFRRNAPEESSRLPLFSPNSFLSLLLHGFGASAFARNTYGQPA